MQTIKITTLSYTLLFALSKQILKAIVFTAFLTALIILCYYYYEIISIKFSDADQTVVAGLVIASITALTSLFGIFLSKYLEIKDKQLNDLRINKTVVYENLSELIFKILRSVKEENMEEKIDEMVDLTFNVNQKILIWGSDKVVSSLIKYRQSVEEKDANKIFASMGNLYLSIRKDLGHDNKDINETNILTIFSNIK